MLYAIIVGELYNDKWRIMIATGIQLLGIKHQGPDLNGLPLRDMRRTSAVVEGRVRRQTCLVDVGIEALDKGDFV